MKKFIVGFLAGLLVASAFPVYGAITSLVGKKVQKEYTVIVNGKTLDKKAIAIDGTSYPPLRLIANAIGYDIAFTNDTVIMNDPALEGRGPVEKPAENPNQAELDSINTRINEINRAEGEYPGKRAKLMIDWNNNSDKRDDIQKQIDALDSNMKNLLAEREQLEKRKAELESSQ